MWFMLSLLYWAAAILSIKSSMFMYDIDCLVQERRNSIANALELRLSFTKPSIYNLVRL